MRLPVCLVDMNAIRSVFIGLHDTVPPGGGWEFVHDLESDTTRICTDCSQHTRPLRFSPPAVT